MWYTSRNLHVLCSYLRCWISKVTTTALNIYIKTCIFVIHSALFINLLLVWFSNYSDTCIFVLTECFSCLQHFGDFRMNRLCSTCLHVFLFMSTLTCVIYVKVIYRRNSLTIEEDTSWIHIWNPRTLFFVNQWYHACK